jgi:hypothetical protein
MCWMVAQGQQVAAQCRLGHDTCDGVMLVNGEERVDFVQPGRVRQACCRFIRHARGEAASTPPDKTRASFTGLYACLHRRKDAVVRQPARVVFTDFANTGFASRTAYPKELGC